VFARIVSTLRMFSSLLNKPSSCGHQL
jgi:hypothetical protein